jgi:hypothetical protein
MSSSRVFINNKANKQTRVKISRSNQRDLKPDAVLDAILLGRPVSIVPAPMTLDVLDAASVNSTIDQDSEFSDSEDLDKYIEDFFDDDNEAGYDASAAEISCSTAM